MRKNRKILKFVVDGYKIIQREVNMNLSKSKYCNAIQCPKMLWLSKYKKEVFDDGVMNQSVLEQGNEVGDLAMGLFGEYVEVPYSDLSEMIKTTDKLMKSDERIIAEASFSYEGLFCSVDILKKVHDRHIEIYEVKSASEVHDIYYDDVAYQYYVLTKIGYIVDKACVVHINSSYVRGKELDLNTLFVVADITKEAKDKQEEVKQKLCFLDEYLKEKNEPEKELSLNCFEPYDCGFFKYCTRNLPEPNVFDVARLSKKKKIKYYNEGIISFKDLYNKKDLTGNYLKQIEHEVMELEPEINVAEIRKFVNTLHYPIYFLDFETFSSAIPMYENSSPYQQIPFQFSLHFIESENAPLQHTEFLAEPGIDPRKELAERLCTDIPKNVCVTAYNMGFEKGRIKELAKLYPELAEHLMNIHDNIVDLMIPFQKKHYYQKEMRGSYSIKYVLPALFPNEPELNYLNLEGVHNGSEASETFRKLNKMNTIEQKKHREYLLKYCKLDTFAMVKIWQRLLEVVGIKSLSLLNYDDLKISGKNQSNEILLTTNDKETKNIAINKYEKSNSQICKLCGAKLRNIAKYCSECGTKVHQDIRISDKKKVSMTEQINIKIGKKCCWEIRENIVLYNYWGDSFTITDLRNPEVLKNIEMKGLSPEKIIDHWNFYMKGYEEHQVIINDPIWISDVIDNKFFYIDNSANFYKCTFALEKDKSELWENVQYLIGGNNEIRILASNADRNELTNEFYLFDVNGDILWNADVPVRLDGYDRKIGYEFSCNENYFSNNQMLIDFHTGQEVLKDAFAIIGYLESKTNAFIVDYVRKQDDKNNYVHEIYYYDKGKLIPTNEILVNTEVTLTIERFIPLKENDMDFKPIRDVKRYMDQSFM